MMKRVPAAKDEVWDEGYRPGSREAPKSAEFKMLDEYDGKWMNDRFL